MKRIATILTGLTLAVLFSVGAAHAQDDGQKTTANIPFEFTAGNLTFPAGQYEFIRIGVGLYKVRDANRHSLFVMGGVPSQPYGITSEKSNLKFETVNGRHILVQIWNDSALNGSEFPAAIAPGELLNTRP
jgi:hypothetical protein